MTKARSLPIWLKWGLRILAVLMLAGLIASLPFLWKAAQPLIPVLKKEAHASRQIQIRIFAKLVGGLVGLIIWTCLAVWLFWRASKRREKQMEAVAASVGKAETAAIATQKAPKCSKGKHWNTCNVLQTGIEAHQVWQFNARNNFVLDRDETTPADEPLPAHLVNKSWGSIWQPKLNVAYLPPESVFLRVVHLPKSSFDETLSMVELQLEKLSPIPVTQVVWSMHVLPQGTENLQTMIVTLVERKAVEEFLGQLEGQGYLADRLELPVLDRLLATPIREDGAWIYPGVLGGKSTAVVAWWYGGILQNLNFIAPSAIGDRPTSLKNQLMQMAWAGELEGWLTKPPAWYLVADEATIADWEPLLRQGLDEPISISHPMTPPELAALTAQRAAQTQHKINLIPSEYTIRYHQTFVDRLWLQGLAAVVGLYMVGAMIYFVALAMLVLQTRSVEKEVTALSSTYTNTLQLKARYQVLKDRQELKFAALDCWQLTAEKMPTAISLDRLSFSDGKKWMLSGTAPSDQTAELIEFSAAMRKAELDGQPMFDPQKGEQLSYRMNPGSSSVNWNFSLELKRAEVE